jgi:hypothetical protein
MATEGMGGKDSAMQDDDLLRKRAAARRTAWVLGAVALAIFAAFIMTGIIGRNG